MENSNFEIELYTKDTQKIERTYKIFQTINLISFILVLIGGLITTCIMAEDFGAFCLIPLGAALIWIPVYIITSLLLNILFGMFFDIRRMRMHSDNAPQNEASATAVEDEIPEL